MTMISKPGVGHQFKMTVKALNATKTTLEEAYAHIHEIDGDLAAKINLLIKEANDKACSAQDALNN
jgi:hypothetical protein